LIKIKTKKSFYLNILKLTGFFTIFLLSFFISVKFSQSFHFVDEDDHLVFAHFMNKGYKLYDDLSSNHQPLVYFFSSLGQKIIQPKTLFSLITGGRLLVFAYGFLWSLFLLFQFGPIILVFILFY